MKIKLKEINIKKNAIKAVIMLGLAIISLAVILWLRIHTVSFIAFLVFAYSACECFVQLIDLIAGVIQKNVRKGDKKECEEKNSW